MKKTGRFWMGVCILMTSALACNLNVSGPGVPVTTTPGSTATPTSAAEKPQIEFTSGNGVFLNSSGDHLEVEASAIAEIDVYAADSVGVEYVELQLDGAEIDVDSPASPQQSFNGTLTWIVSQDTGSHQITLLAYSTDGRASDPLEIPVDILPPATSTVSAPLPTDTPLGPPPLDFSGHWFTNFGTLDIVQSGRDFTGTFYDGLDKQSGGIEGTVSGDHLSGMLVAGDPSASFLDPQIELTLGAGGLTFTGQRLPGGGNRASEWCGAKAGHHFPDGCSFAGQWTIHREPASPDCDSKPLTLVREDEHVDGVYCGYRTIKGIITYTAGTETILQGTLLNQDSTGAYPLTLYLVDLNGDQFQGNWNGNYEFCGWRAGGSSPTYCMR